MALKKFVSINVNGIPQEQAATDELQLGKVTISGVLGVAIDALNALISNVATPISPGDAVNKAYVDGLINTSSLSMVRYWFVDYDAGSDTSVGYIDAVLGSTFTAGQTGPVALKTLERLAQLMPRFGNGRGTVVLIKNRALGSFYRNIANTADDILDLRGHTGYEFEIFRGSSDLSNDALDRVFCGGVQNPVGPDAGGAFTISSVTDSFTFGIATTPWTANTLNGRRVRFAADASAPYANQCISIQTNSTGGLVLMERISATLPLVGDKFYIETPGVQVARIVNGEMHNAYRTTSVNTANARRTIVGFSFNATALGAFLPDGAQHAFIEQSAAVATYVTFASSGPLAPIFNINRTYNDETGTSRRPGSSIFNAGASLTTYNMICSGNAFNHPSLTSIVSYARGSIAGGTYFAFAPTLQYCGWTPGAAGTSAGSFTAARFGQISTTAQRRVVVAAGVVAADYCNLQFEGVEFLSSAATPYLRLRGQGCNITVDNCVGNSGTDVCVEAVSMFDSSLVCDRLSANSMTASLGAIRGNGGAIAPTFVSLAGRTVIDQARNRICGTGVMAVQNEQQLAADPASPTIGDNWWRTDNKLALRGSDAATRYVWFTKGEILAEQTAATRYFAVDYINGVDTRLGYSDVDAATAGTVSIKTLTRLKQIVPVFGQGQVIVILVAGDPTGADLQYLKPDAVTLDDLDLRLYGYRKVFVRSTRNFVNDTADKTILGAAIGVTGPDVGGVWTCAGGSTTSNIVTASATLPAETTATMMRVRFTGNVTAALANQCRNIWFNDSSNIIPGLNLTNAPAAGDTFYIERPGVSVNNININIYGGSGLAFNQGDNAVVICGFRARQTDASPSTFNYNSNDIRLSFMEAGQFLSVKNTGFFRVDSQYQDEASTPNTITTGLGIRHAQNRSVIFQGLTSVAYNESGVYSANTNLFIGNCVSYTIGKACYWARRLSLNFCGTGSANAPGIFLFGSGGTGQPSRHVNAAAGIPIVPTSTNGRFDGVDISNAGTNPCIAIASVGQALLSFRNITSRAGGNTGVVVSCGEAGFALPVSSRLDFATTVGSIASGGDLKIGDASIVTFASVQLSRVIDIWGNDYGGILGTDQPITRKTPGIFYNVPLQTIDPVSPIIADLWTRTDNRMALRGTDAITRYAQFTRVPAIAEWDTANTRYVAVDPVAGDDTRIGYIDAPHGTSWGSSATLDAVSVKTLEEVFQRIMPLNGNRRRLVILIKGNAAAATPIDVLNKAGTALDFVDVRGIVPWSYAYFSVRASNFMNDAADIGAGARMKAYSGPNGDGSYTVSSYAAPVITLSAGTLLTGNELAGLSIRFKGNITAALANRVNVCKYAPTAGTLEIGASAASLPVLNDEFFIEKPSIRMGLWAGNISSVSRIKRAALSDGYSPWVSSICLVMPATNVTGPHSSPHWMTSVSGCTFDCITNATTLSFYMDYANLFSTRLLENGTDVSTFHAFRVESNFVTTAYNMGAASRFDLSQILYFGTTNAFSVKGSTQVVVGSAYIHGTLQLVGGNNESSWPNFFTIGGSTANSRTVVRGTTTGVQLRSTRGVLFRFVSFVDLAGSAIEVIGNGATTLDLGDCTAINVAGYGVNLSTAFGTRLVIQNTTLASGTLGDILTSAGIVTFSQLAYLGFKDTNNNVMMTTSVGDEVTQGVKCTASGAIALGDTVRVTASGVATKAQANNAANATDVFGCAQNAAVDGATFMVVGAGHGLIGFTTSPPTAPGIAYLSVATAGLCTTVAPAVAGNQLLRIGKLLRPIAGQPLAVCSIRPEYEPVTI